MLDGGNLNHNLLIGKVLMSKLNSLYICLRMYILEIEGLLNW